MPKKGTVLKTKRQEVINQVENVKLREFLWRLCEADNTYGWGMPYVRMLCSYTREDWALYMACLDYEILENRDEDDQQEVSVIHQEIGTPQEWSMLTEEQFNEIKDEYPLSKKLNYDFYTCLRWRAYRMNHKTILEEAFTSS